MNYKEQIKSPKWQKKRLEILNRDEFTCQNCGDKELQLHVHHKHYNKGAKIWEYENWELTTLCEDCHSIKHEPKKENTYFTLINSYIVDFDDYEICYLESLLNKYLNLRREISSFSLFAKIDSFLETPASYNRLLRIIESNLEYEFILARLRDLEERAGL